MICKYLKTKSQLVFFLVDYVIITWYNIGTGRGPSLCTGRGGVVGGVP